MLTTPAQPSHYSSAIRLGTQQGRQAVIFDRRSFLFLMAWAALASTAAAKDGDSDSGSDGDSGGNSGSGGDDGGDSDSDNSGPGNSNDDSDDNDDDDGDAEDDAIDQDDALKAVRGGEIIPLNEAIDIVKRRSPGKIIDVSLKRRSFSDVYSFKVKSSAGRVVTVRMNARTGAIMGF
jgi:hypothetical protein